MAKFLIAFFLITACTSSPANDLDKTFEKVSFAVGDKIFSAYIADDDAKRSRGLMFVKKLPADTGMLFVFENERPLGFWMKNTLIPLSIGFFNAKTELVDVQEMKPGASANDIPTYESRGPAVIALEMDAGWFAKNKIKNGVQLKLLSSTKSALLKAKLAR